MKKYIFSLALSTVICATSSTMATPVKFNTVGYSVKAENSGGIWTVVTDNNKNASYQLESQKIPVKAGDTVQIAYDITVTKGQIALGFLSSKRNSWYANELVLKEGTHKGVYKTTVPKGEEHTTAVIRNYHLTAPGQSSFAAKNMEFNVTKK